MMKSGKRSVSLRRRTKETDVSLRLEVDGKGEYEGNLQDSYLTHMLTTLARYASFDLEVDASGDLTHHVAEDVAIVMGRVLRQAIGTEAVSRFSSHIVPMDEALVLVAIDLADRPYHEVDLPNAVFRHFLRTLASEARMTLHVHVIKGSDEHHMVEAAFKALGLSFREALSSRWATESIKGRAEWM